MTVREVLEEAERLAQERGADATEWDARILLAHALGRRNPLSGGPSDQVEPAAADRFEELWSDRVRGIPVQHLLGEWDFYGRPFRVDGRALVPRPETELVVEAALRRVPEPRRILDAGTGSGILAISLALERPAARAVALDASLEALALARENALRHAVLRRVSLLGSDWVSALSRGAFDLAVANPPYLALSEAPVLPSTVRDHDPPAALFARPDALAAIRLLLQELPLLMERGAPLVFEIGQGQESAVEREIRARRAWTLERIEPDGNGIPRVVVATRTGESSS